MKNNTVYSALALFFSFAAAVVYIILYILGLLPDAAFVANLGIIMSVTVLVVLSCIVAKQHYKSGASLYNTFNCYGNWLIWAAVICLCLSVLLILLSDAETMLFVAVLFAVIWSWKFTVIMWALFLCGALPCNRCTQNNCSNSTF